MFLRYCILHFTLTSASIDIMKWGKIVRNVDCLRERKMVGWIPFFCEWKKACFYPNIEGIWVKSISGQYYVTFDSKKWLLNSLLKNKLKNITQYNQKFRSQQIFMKRLPCVKFLYLIVKTSENQFKILMEKCVFVEKLNSHKCSKKMRSVRRL